MDRTDARSLAAPSASVRRADLDTLKVLAILTVFLVHCATVFSPWQGWHIQNVERSRWIGELTLVAWPWVMPLFMLLAGAGTWYSLAHRSDAEYVRIRSIRLLIPLVLGTFLLVPPQVYVQRLSQGRFQGSYLEFLPHFLDGLQPEGNFTVGHLWFLAYLYVYALALLPLLRFLRAPAGERWTAELDRVLRSPAAFLLLPSLPLSASQVALRGAFPEQLAFLRDWATQAWLVLCYLYGFALVTRPGFETALERSWRWALAPALASIGWISWTVWTSQEEGFLPRPYTGTYLVFWTVFGVASWSWLVMLLGGASRHFRSRGRFLDWARRAVFPFYILHQTVIVVTAFWIVRLDEGPGVKLALLILICFAVTVALVELGRRWRVSRVLLGLSGT